MVRPPVIEPRGLRRDDAGRYVGVSPTKFAQLVDDGRMPSPLRVDRCVLWDRRALDSAFDDLADEAHAPAIMHFATRLAIRS